MPRAMKCPNGNKTCYDEDCFCPHRVPHSMTSGCTAMGENDPCPKCVPMKLTNKERIEERRQKDGAD